MKELSMKKVRSSQIESDVPYFGEKYQSPPKEQKTPVKVKEITDDSDSDISGEKSPELNENYRLPTAVFGGSDNDSIVD